MMGSVCAAEDMGLNFLRFQWWAHRLRPGQVSVKSLSAEMALLIVVIATYERGEFGRTAEPVPRLGPSRKRPSLCPVRAGSSKRASEVSTKAAWVTRAAKSSRCTAPSFKCIPEPSMASLPSKFTIRRARPRLTRKRTRLRRRFATAGATPWNHTPCLRAPWKRLERL
jgi:hypothetical protein